MRPAIGEAAKAAYRSQNPLNADVLSDAEAEAIATAVLDAALSGEPEGESEVQSYQRFGCTYWRVWSQQDGQWLTEFLSEETARAVANALNWRAERPTPPAGGRG